jgi:tetratricopeptide (TPR) repeat protein
MASGGGKEGRMLFDIRGRRKTAVKVVYAVLAVLMGASLFLVVGPLNIGELFNGGESSGSAAKQFEEQSERLERKLKKDPGNVDLLQSLTRAQVNAANSSIEVNANGEQGLTVSTLKYYQQSSESWSKYLEATEQPNAGLAQLMANTLFRMAEISRTLTEAEANVEAAAEAQKIVADQRPNLGALSTLSLYTLFTFEYPKARQLEQEALKLAPTKPARESFENQFKEAEKRAREIETAIKEEEQARKKAQQGGGEAGTTPESLEGPGPLGGALGGGVGLGE